MKIALLSIPARGEINVLLATCCELIRLGHDVTIFTGSSFRGAIDSFRNEQDDPLLHSRIHYCDLGRQKAVEDLTREIQAALKDMRKQPGDYTSMEAHQTVALVPRSQFRDAATNVCDRLLEMDPDMIVVDALSPTVIAGTRMTGLPFMFTVPCSPSLTASRKNLFDPHPMGTRRSRTILAALENLKLTVRETYGNLVKKDLYARRSVLKHDFGLESMGFNADSAIVPPLWKDRNCVGGIHFNTPGLCDAPRQPHQITFVGAGITSDPENHDSPDYSVPTPLKGAMGSDTVDPDVEWLDAAHEAGQQVVYLNMGSMFLWTDKEVRAALRAFERLYRESDGKVKLLFKLNKPKQSPASPGATSPVSSPTATTTPELDEKRPILESRRPSGASTLVAEKLSEAIKNNIKIGRKTDEEKGYSQHTLSEFEGLEYVRFTRWVADQRRIYKHPALRVVIHHGGGNSFNEAVHYGLPQMVLSQWFDTHEYAILVEKFGIGLRSKYAPYLNEDDMVNNMKRMLSGQEAEQIRRNAKIWSTRSRIAGGAPAAARLIETQAMLCLEQKQANRRSVIQKSSVEALPADAADLISEGEISPDLLSSAASTATVH